MAQIAANYPAIPEDWGMLGGMMRSNQYNNATNADQINQLQGLQDIYKAQAMNPLDVEGKDLSNQFLGAQIPGMQADSWEKQRNMEVRKGVPVDEESKAKLAEIASKVSGDQLTQAENNIKAAMTHPDPSVRADAQAAWPMLASVREMYEKQRLETERAIGVAKEHGAGQLAVMQESIAGGRYAHAWQASIEQKLITETDLIKKDGLLRQALAQAEDDARRAQTPEDQQKAKEAYFRYYGELQAIQPAVQAENNRRLLGATGGKPNPSAAFGIPSNVQGAPAAPVPPVSPAMGGSASAATGGQPTQPHTMSELKTLYPNVDPEKLKKAYKAKYGVDPKP